MSFKNLLDLRRGVGPQIKIVERVVFKKRSFAANLSIVFFATSFLVISIWEISRAGNTESAQDKLEAYKQMLDERAIPAEERITFGTRGEISEINGSVITILNAKNKKGEEGNTFFVEISLANIKSKTEEVLTGSDLEVGQEVIVKGVVVENTILAHTLVLFSESILVETATTTETEIATTSQDISSSTDSTLNTDSLSSIDTNTETQEVVIPSFIDTVTDAMDQAVEVISDAVSEATNTITEITTEETVTEIVVPEDTTILETPEPEIQESEEQEIPNEASEPLTSNIEQ